MIGSTQYVIYSDTVIGQREKCSAMEDRHPAKCRLTLDDQTPACRQNRWQMGKEQTRQRVLGAVQEHAHDEIALGLDIHDRGLDGRTMVVACGEFGRTPRVATANGCTGRDHYPDAMSALLSGGGLRTGQVIGSTNRLGEVPHDRPIHYQDVFATLYRQLGIDVGTATIPDPSGRPQYLLDRREPIRELV